MNTFPNAKWAQQYRRTYRTFRHHKYMINVVKGSFEARIKDGYRWTGAKRLVPNRLAVLGLRVFVSRYYAPK